MKGLSPDESHGPLPSIRRMLEGDLDRVMAIAEELQDAPHWTRAAYVAAIRRSGFLIGVGLVARFKRDAKIAGFLVGGVLASDAELELIAVAREAQGRGIGRALLEAFETHVKREGAHWILLEVRASNERALKLYRRQGFQDVGRRPDYYSDPLEDAILMNKGL